MFRLLFGLLAALALPAAAMAASPIGSTNMTFDPGHGTQVEYLAADGGAHLWYPGNSVILHGQWKKQGTGYCFKYGPNTYNPVTHVYGDKWECEPNGVYTSGLVEQAKGDPLVSLLIKELGIYPPGCYVKLVNGETGVVTRVGEMANKHVVAAFVTADGNVLARPVRRDTTVPAYAIASTVPDSAIKVTLSADKLYERA